jgi:TRAP-type mannitol/chloroaromatic compound transport system permease small subunit
VDNFVHNNTEGTTISMWSNIKSLLGGISRVAGKSVSYCTLLMVLGMFTSTLLSKISSLTGHNLAGISLIALQESVTWLHAAVFMLGAAYTLQQNEHVRVDIFYNRFSQKTKAIIDIVGTLIFLLPVSVFILISSWRYVALSWKLGEASAEAGGLPGVYLLKTLVIVMPLLLIIEGLHQLMEKIDQLRAPQQGGAA